jgi:hypothetical protein
MPKTQYFETAVLNAALRNTAYSSPTTVYVALYTGSPTPTTTGTEVSGGSYTRQAASFSAPVAGAVSNTLDITYPIATSSWGTVVAFAILDDPNTGNMLYFGSLTTSRVVNMNDQIKFPAGQLTVTEA